MNFLIKGENTESVIFDVSRSPYTGRVRLSAKLGDSTWTILSLDPEKGIIVHGGIYEGLGLPLDNGRVRVTLD